MAIIYKIIDGEIVAQDNTNKTASDINNLSFEEMTALFEMKDTGIYDYDLTHTGVDETKIQAFLNEKIDKNEIINNLLSNEGKTEAGQSCAVCDEFFLKVKTLYVELNGIKQDELGKFKSKLQDWLNKRAPSQWNEGAIPCGANNPYAYDTVEYWIQEWVARSNDWEDAVVLAKRAKLDMWTDNKTAAEHYIASMALSNQENAFFRHGYKITGIIQVLIYSGAKGSSIFYKGASSTSINQVKYGLIGWAHGNYFEESPFAGEFGKCNMVGAEDLPVRGLKASKNQELARLLEKQEQLQKQLNANTYGDYYNAGSEVQKYWNDQLNELENLNKKIHLLEKQIPTISEYEPIGKK